MDSEKGKIVFENNSDSFIDKQLWGLPKLPRSIPMPAVKPCKEVFEVFNGVYSNNSDDIIKEMIHNLNTLINSGDEIKIIIERREGL